MLIPEILEDGKVVALATDGLSPDKAKVLCAAIIPVSPLEDLKVQEFWIQGGQPELTEQFTGITPTYYHSLARPEDEVWEEICGHLEGVVVGYSAVRFLSQFLTRKCIQLRKDCLVDLMAIGTGKDALETIGSAARSGMTLTRWYDALRKAGGRAGSMENMIANTPGMEWEAPTCGEPAVLSIARNTKRLMNKLLFGRAFGSA